MTDNLAIWNRHADIDPKFTKPITGKAYKGTSPSPQYVIQCLTETFGPVGLGFGWDVVAEDFTPMGDEVLHWCRIRFWHTDRANAFDSYGQTKALMKTKNGLMLDEDAPKKSLTDAIVKAASHLGIAANIFLGRWDDQKYVAEVNKEFRGEEKTGQATATIPADPPFDPRAAADRIIGRLNKARDFAQLRTIWTEEWPTIQEIGAIHPAMADEITTAKDKRKVEIDPAAQAPAMQGEAA